MPPIKRYSDPTLGFNRFSNVRYPSSDSILNKDLFPKTDINFGKAITPDNKYFNPDMAKIQGSFDSLSLKDSQTEKEGNNFGTVAKDLLPYASNLVNSFRKLPKPIAPGLEAPATFTPISLDADRTAINNQGTAFNKETDYRVGNRVMGQALKAKMKSGNTLALNDLSQKEALANANLKRGYDELNQGVQVRNLGRTKNYNDENIQRILKGQELDSENLANMSDKYQMQTRDKALQYQEGEKNLIQSFSVDETLLGPNSRKAREQWRNAQMKRLGYDPNKVKFGGYLKRMK